MNEPTTITVRYTGNTYVARAKGYKKTVSCTISARLAGEVMAKKLGLDPRQLRLETDCGGQDLSSHVFSFRTVDAQPGPVKRYDTLVVEGMRDSIPTEVDGMRVAAWASGHALNRSDELETFIRAVALGHIENPEAAANDLMERMGWT